MRQFHSPERRLRACVSCTKARAQCHFQPSNVDRHLCDRCERLGRACEARTDGALRRPRRIRGAAGEPVSSSVSHDVALREREHRGELLSHDSNSVPEDCRVDLPFDLTGAQTACIVHIYCTDYIPNFPFVPLFEEISAEELYHMKPMAFRSIMLVAAPLPVNRVEAIKNEVLVYASSKLLVKDTRSLDMLQGLLLCIAWANLNNVCDERITTLTYLALGLAHTLGITKVPLPLLEKIDKDKKSSEDIRKGGKGDTHRMKLHSLEEQRTYLGLYYVLSINSVHFGRKNPLNGAYIPFCLEAIRSAQEYPTDSTLVHLIRMTQVSERISSPNISERDTEAYASLVEGGKQSLKAELDRLRESIADVSTGDSQEEKKMHEIRKKYLELGYYCLIARFNEPATHLPNILASGGTASAHRSLRLHDCLNAVIAYFEIVLSLPPESMLYQNLAFAEQATFTLVLATRLCVSSAGARDWDVEMINKKFDMTSTIKRLVDKMRDVEVFAKGRVVKFVGEFGVDVREGEYEEIGYWGAMSEKMGNIGSWFEKMSRKEEDGGETGAEVDELLYRVGASGRAEAQDAFDEGNEPAWIGLLPMGNLGWRFDDD